MKNLAILLAASFLSVSCFAGEWVTLTKNSATEASKGITQSKGQMVFTVNVPGYEKDAVTVEGNEYTTVQLSGTSVLLQKGAPELRKVTAFVRIPACTSVKATLLSSTPVEKETGVILPSKGNLTRDVNPDDVSLEFGAAYQQKWFPADTDMISVSAPFQMRDVWGVRVTVVPFQYNHAENKLRIHTSLQISLEPQGVKKSISTAAKSASFEKLYSTVFLNSSNREITAPEQPIAPVEAVLAAPAEAQKLLIVTHDSFAAAVEPLRVWKTQLGFAVKVVKLSEIGTTADELKAYFQQKYDAGDLCHIILVGDSQQIPTLKGKMEKADSDPCYTKLAGNDNVPDAFISRISVETPEQAEYVIQKSIHYEQYPMQGADGAWYKKSLAIASAQGSPKDFERLDVLNNALTQELQFSKIFTCYDTTSWGGAPKQVVFDAFAEGVGIINYCGHGSASSWVSSGFNTTDAGKLTNGMKLPVAWSVACVNSQFVGKTCFAEAMLRAGNKDNPAGCLMFAGASTNMAWVPPCVWQKEIIAEQTCKKLHDVLAVQHVYGILKTMEEYGADDRSEGNQLFEQTHIFGDGTIKLRTEPAAALTWDIKRVPGRLVLKLNNGANAVVTVYDDNYNNLIVVRADAKGEVNLPLNGQTMFSVTGDNLAPMLDNQI